MRDFVSSVDAVIAPAIEYRRIVVGFRPSFPGTIDARKARSRRPSHRPLKAAVRGTETTGDIVS
jgi:hypothetical protein